MFTALVRFLLNYTFLGLLGTADLVKATVIGQNSKLHVPKLPIGVENVFFLFSFPESFP